MTRQNFNTNLIIYGTIYSTLWIYVVFEKKRSLLVQKENMEKIFQIIVKTAQ